MDAKIIENNENKLFGRKEVKIEISSETSPKRDEVRKWLANELSVSEEGIKVLSILGGFGHKNFTCEANVYGSREALEKIENVRKRDTLPEKPAEEVKEEVKEEPKEEKVEEKKEEVKEEPKEEVKEEAPKEEVKEESSEKVKEEPKEEKAE